MWSRADFDIFAAKAAHSGLMGGTSSSNCKIMSDILEIHLFIGLGTYFVMGLIRQPWLYSKMQEIKQSCYTVKYSKFN